MNTVSGDWLKSKIGSHLRTVFEFYKENEENTIENEDFPFYGRLLIDFDSKKKFVKEFPGLPAHNHDEALSLLDNNIGISSYPSDAAGIKIGIKELVDHLGRVFNSYSNRVDRKIDSFSWIDKKILRRKRYKELISIKQKNQSNYEKSINNLGENINSSFVPMKDNYNVPLLLEEGTPVFMIKTENIGSKNPLHFMELKAFLVDFKPFHTVYHNHHIFPEYKDMDGLLVYDLRDDKGNTEHTIELKRGVLSKGSHTFSVGSRKFFLSREDAKKHIELIKENFNSSLDSIKDA